MTIEELQLPISASSIGEVAEVFESAFGHPPGADFAGRVKEKRKLSVLVAGDGRLEGFKIGYERHRGVFFSWLGGVRDGARRQGIARALLRHQHALCLARGYTEIQTETFGDETGMLILNLQEGFEVYGSHVGRDSRMRVQLRKVLSG